MNPELKKLNEDIKTQLASALGLSSMQETIAKTRAATADDTGTFEVIISTDAVDRQGESITQAGWDLTFFKMNPVVLWAHDYYQMPIGVCDEIGVVDGKLVAKGRFAPADANPFGQQVRKLYDLGMVRTTSVGFIAKEVDGSTITIAELLEFSFVPVPANPYAVSLRQIKDLCLSPFMLSTKGINLDVKADPKEGDVCTMDDGSEGVMAMADGQMVCTVKTQAKAEGDVCTLEDGTEGVTDAEGACVPKPAETAPADPAKGQKGAVQDELDADEAYENKWDQLDPVLEAVNAFIDVYLDDTTTPDQFGALVGELSGILAELAKGNDTGEPAEADGTTEASLNTGTVKTRIGKAKKYYRKEVEGAGIETSPEGQKPADGIVAETSGDVAGEETAGEQTPKERSMDAGTELLAEIKNYSDSKTVLRAIATVVTDSLTRINAQDRRNKK